MAMFILRICSWYWYNPYEEYKVWNNKTEFRHDTDIQIWNYTYSTFAPNIYNIPHNQDVKRKFAF